MKIVGATERATLFKNRRLCLETTFRQREHVTLLQWGITLVLAVVTYLAISVFGLMFILDKLQIKNENMAKLIYLCMVLGSVGIVIGIMYIIFRIYNYRRAWNDFLLHGHLEMNTAIVKRVKNKCVTYLEKGSVDATGNPYLIDYQIDASGVLFKKPKESDTILVLHGEDSWHNEVTRIAMVNAETSKYLTDVNDVTQWENLNRYPHDAAVHLQKGPLSLTKEEKDALLKKGLKNQIKIQLKYVIMFALGIVLAFTVLAVSMWYDTKNNGGTVKPLGLYIAIAEAIAAFWVILARMLGVRNIKAQLPKEVKSVHEVLHLNSKFAMYRYVEVCIWDEEKQNYVQKNYPICNMFFKNKRMGTVYYMVTGSRNEHLLVDKEHMGN
ncbi:MAG: hypothetical protein Q4D51_09920 [Eubacteriales bacterium]|nr:hypothetical protein [Eubacteriales bacterium]